MPESRLSDAELYIMRRFWDYGPLRTDELSAYVADKNWKPTTLLTFLSRLVAKGMLTAEKTGKSNLYRPLVSKEAYTGSESKALLNELYGGSARDFLAALVDGNAISQAELASLKHWLNGQEVNGE